MNSNETSLQLINNRGILAKIVNFFKKILGRDKSNYMVSNNNIKIKEEDKKSFYNLIKFNIDPDIELLLKIQNKLEKRGINKENAKLLTKDLSAEQKNKLENLYKKQIADYENSIKTYKNKILTIKKQIG